jgi:carbamoyl-phosphate synthase large subunit
MREAQTADPTAGPRPHWRVLVLPSVNEPGLEVIRALLRNPRFTVLGASALPADVDPSASLVAKRVVLPTLGDRGFEAALRETIAREAIDVVFPTVDALVAELASWPDRPALFVVPRADVAARCLSKRATAEAVGHLVATPRAFERDADVVFPAWAKPDRGSGSRGSGPVVDDADLAVARARGHLVLEYLPGDEYTVDCCGDADGELLVASVRRRAAVGRGIALASELVEDAPIEAAVRAIAAHLRIAGPFFVQFRRRADGTPVLLEINARVGGSMGLTRLAGANIPQMAIWALAGHAVRAPRLLRGARAVRCLDTRGGLDGFALVVWDLDDTLLRADGTLDPGVFAHVVDYANRGIRQVVLSRNVDPDAALASRHARGFFERVIRTSDKVGDLVALLEELGLAASSVVSINDSIAERLALEERLPDLVQLTPDAVDLLAFDPPR